MNLKLTNVPPDDYILAIRAAKSFIVNHAGRDNGVRNGLSFMYGGIESKIEKWFYVYRVKTGVVVRGRDD